MLLEAERVERLPGQESEARLGVRGHAGGPAQVRAEDGLQIDKQYLQ